MMRIVINTLSLALQVAVLSRLPWRWLDKGTLKGKVGWISTELL